MVLRKIYSPLLRDHPNTRNATYSRALAALFVMSIHYGGFGLREVGKNNIFINQLLNNLIDFGSQGPVIFFVSSGFVLQLTYGSMLKNRKSLIFKIFIYRWFRLAPMYLLVTLFAYKFVYTGNQSLSLSLLIKKSFFLDGFFKDAYLFQPIFIGEWIVAEFWLTIILLVPTIFLGSKKIKKNILYLLLFTSFFANYLTLKCKSGSINIVICEFTKNNTIIENFIINQFYFLLGSLLIQLKPQSKLFRRVNLLTNIFLSFGILFINSYRGYYALFWAITFLYSENNKLLRKNWIQQYLLLPIGNSCYSIYLIHYPLMEYLIKNNILNEHIYIALIVIFFSFIGFMIVEVPFNKLGRRTFKNTK